MPTHPFTRAHRLLQPDDFQRVMEQPTLRASRPGFLLLVRENDLDVARIGFVLPKRRLRRAVARNRVKRIIREAFRRQQAALSGLDIVVMARDGLDALDKSELRAGVDSQFQYITRKLARPSPPPPADDLP